MEKVFEQAKDLHVRNVIVYGNNTDNKLYREAEYETEITTVELEDMFKKGALLINDGTNLLVGVVFAGNQVKTLGVADEDVVLVAWTAKTPE